MSDDKSQPSALAALQRYSMDAEYDRGWCMRDFDDPDGEWMKAADVLAAWPTQAQGEADERLTLDGDPKRQELFSAAIQGAISYGHQGVNKPPEGHWLTNWWEHGHECGKLERKLAILEPHPYFGSNANPKELWAWIGPNFTGFYETKPEAESMQKRSGGDVVRFAAHPSPSTAAIETDEEVLDCLKHFACAPPQHLSKEWFELVDRSVNAIAEAKQPDTAALREALRECADDLEAEINGRLPEDLRNQYERFQREYKRDMDPVERAHMLLAGDNRG